MIEKVISEILKKQQELAESVVRFPNAERYLHNSGVWQGLQQAMDIINGVLNDQDE